MHLADGWASNTISVLCRLGINAKEVDGFVPSADEAFARAKWVEAPLPNGGRLVIDVGEDKLVIEAGQAADYIVPHCYPRIPLA